MITTATTPQPYHGKEVSKLDQLRNTYEQELWDDLSSVIFAAKAATLTIHVRVACRIWIVAQGDLNGAGTLTINVDSVAQTPTTTVGGAITAVVNTYIDVLPGTHTITITSGATITDHLIVARLGRRPPTV